LLRHLLCLHWYFSWLLNKEYSGKKSVPSENKPQQLNKTKRSSTKEQCIHVHDKNFNYKMKEYAEMKKKQFLGSFIISVLAVFILAACDSGNSNEGSASSEGEDAEKLQVVGDFTIMSDIAEKVGGDRVDVYNIIPQGNEPHDWDPSPDASKNTADTDVFFYFGWNLEVLDSDSENWVYKLLYAVDKDKDDDNVFALSDGIEQLELETKEFERTPNPHAFNTPKNGITMAENARDAYRDIDADHKEEYEQNADEFIEELEGLDQQYEEKIGEISEEDRILVTSERSFQYVADQYDLEEGFIWERDGEHEGTPEQIKNTIEYVEDNEPNALLDEYTSDKRPMQTVADETGLTVAGSLYSEDLGNADDFVAYLQHNLNTILDALTQDFDVDDED